MESLSELYTPIDKNPGDALDQIDAKGYDRPFCMPSHLFFLKPEMTGKTGFSPLCISRMAASRSDGIFQSNTDMWPMLSQGWSGPPAALGQRT